VDVRIARVPAEIGYYLAGFSDGEGSFNVSFRPRPDYSIPWKVSLSFNVSQKDRVILALFKRHLGCGTLRGRPDGVWYYEVTNLNAIVENVIPFFERFPFLSAKKKRDFAKFKQIVALMQRGAHLTKNGIRDILEIRERMNDGGKRRYLHADILTSLLESSETTRQAPLPSDDDIVRSSSRDEGSTEAIPTITFESIDSGEHK
jgi:LAGLIDADG endonuclease